METDDTGRVDIGTAFDGSRLELLASGGIGLAAELVICEYAFRGRLWSGSLRKINIINATSKLEFYLIQTLSKIYSHQLFKIKKYYSFIK
jgi:hypothetical protein